MDIPDLRLPRGAHPRLGILAAVSVACVFAILGPTRAWAEENLARCAPLAGPRDAINAAQGGRWIELTDLQRAFLAGVFVMNPSTPPGLPYGDKAVLSRIDGDLGGVVFFIDGDRACTPMPIPNELLEMIRAIGAGDVAHEGTEN
jgi:hypothetical protein